ncbi:MAG: hypothetical protein CMD67_01775 [Gammaproteobacteria bacterium]|jgi:acyl-CoA synthetase (NDP forming)|nr:hypothetical protein [Gammaproteobacteria bacterium]
MLNLKNFFSPDSIAVIGASPDTKKLVRGRVMSALKNGGYKGKVYPINPSHSEILGYKAYKSLDDLDAKPDLALIAVTADKIPVILGELAKIGCHKAVIYSAGFAEVGEGSKNLDQKLRAAIEKYKITILGPNAVGFFNVAECVAATFSPGINVENPPRVNDGIGRRLVIISQSGGLGFSIYQRAAKRGINVGLVVSTGNEEGITALDVLDQVIDDNMVGCVALYIEQFRDPHRLSRIAKKALQRGIQIIVVKSGRSDASKRAAISHTASLVGNDSAYEGVFNAFGIFRAYDQDEMLDLAAVFTSCPHTKGNKIGIVSISGGGAIWLADACSDAKLILPEFKPKLQKALREFVPPYGGTSNPVDITAQSLHSDGNIRALELIVKAKDVDMLAVVATLSESAMLKKEKPRLKNLARKSNKPIVFCSYTIPNQENLSDLGDCGIPTFSSFVGCAKALKAIYHHNKFRELSDNEKIPVFLPPSLANFKATNTEFDLEGLYKQLKISTPLAKIAFTTEEAITAANQIGYPVALKLQDPNIAHKSASGAIELALKNEGNLRRSFKNITDNTQNKNSPFLVQAMAPLGIDIILGIVRDNDFGPLLMVGMGGTEVEIIRDISFSPVPIGKLAAKKLLHRVSGLRPLLQDSSKSKINISELIEILVNLAQFADSNRKTIEEFEINPLRLFGPGKKALALDGFLRMSSIEEG